MTITPAMIRALATGEVPLADATPEGIVASEKRGQRELVNSTLMPKKMGDAWGKDHRREYEKLGFVFGEDADDIFVHATLPRGWTRKASDHDMWSSILDDRGRERVAVFYKAAFYDRSARASLARRFKVGSVYEHGEATAEAVFDADEPVMRWSLPARPEKPTEEYWQACDRVRDQAVAWLNERRPEHDDPLAYWDE